MSCENGVAGTCEHVGALVRFFLARKARTNGTDTGWRKTSSTEEIILNEPTIEL